MIGLDNVVPVISSTNHNKHAALKCNNSHISRLGTAVENDTNSSFFMFNIPFNK